MTPPRSPDPAPAADGPLPGVDEYDWLVGEMAVAQGIINVAEARIVELTRHGIDIGVSGGTALTPRRWVEWCAGVSPERAGQIVRVAERSGELVHTMALFNAGGLTLDQMAVVA